MAITFNHNDQVYVKDGKLGVGTNSPGAKLHVKSSGNGTYVVRGMSSSGTDLGGLYQSTAGDGEIYLKTSAVTTNVRISSNNVSYFNGGNLGIGTASPNRPLNIETNTTDVIGALKIKNAGTGDASMFFTVNASGTVWQLGIDNSDGDKFKIGQDNSNADVGVGTKLTIDTSGNVGIGTTSPTRTLHVAGTGRFTGNLYSTSTDVDGIKTRFLSGAANNSTNNGTLYLQYGKSNPVSIGETGSSSLYVAGNVGIGTASPSYKLEVNGKIATPAGAIVIEGQEIYANSEYSGNDGSVRINRFGYLGGQTKFRDTVIYDGKGNQILTVDGSTSYVGIGTTTPVSTLDVVANSGGNALSLRMRPTSNDYSFIQGRSNDGSEVIGEIAFNRTAALTGNMLFYTGNGTNSTERMRITSAGNVGINITSPSQTLDVNGTAYFRGMLGVNGEGKGITVDSGYGVSGRVGLMKYAGLEGMLVAGNTTKLRLGRRTDASTVAAAGTPTIAVDIQVNTDGTIVFPQYGAGYLKTDASGNISVDTSTIEDTLQSVTDRGNSTTNNLRISNSSPDLFFETGATHYNWMLAAQENIDAGFEISVGSQDADSSDDTWSPKLVVKQSGNVGIGTTNPGIELDVAGGIRATAGTANGLRVHTNSGITASNNYMNFFTSQSNGWAFNANGTGADNTTKVVITSGGNVGIGTTSPATKLYVDGGESTFNRGNSDGAIARFRGSNAEQAVIGTTTSWFDSNVGIGTTSPGGRLELNGNGQSWTTAPAIRMWDSYNSKGWLVGNVNNVTAGDFYIRTLPSEDGYPVPETQKEFVIKHSTGNVGIGTMSPAEKLDVNGTIKVNASGATDNFYLRAYEAATERFNIYENGDNVYINTHNDMIFRANQLGGSGGHFVFSGANVGIGTTSPASVLHVKTANDTDKNQGIVVERSANSDRGYINYQGGGFQFRATDGDPIVLGTVSDELVRINSNGNVGIGTTSPSQKLHVAGNTTITGVTYTDYIQTYSGTSIDFRHQDASTVMRVDTTNARVGIGTTSPSEKLDVSGNVKSTGLKLAVNTSMYTEDATLSYYSASNAVYLNGAGNDGWLRLNASGASNDSVAINLFGTSAGNCQTFKTNSAERMRIDSSGNVGIGTTNPTELLELDRDGKIGFGANGDYGIRTGYFDDTGGVHGFHIDTKHGGTWSTRRLVVRADSGNVGIGTTSPSNKLHVYGGRIVIDNAANAQSAIQINSAGSEKTVIYRPSNTEDLRIYTPAAGDAFTLTQAGNVGIGTASPENRLHLLTSTTDTTQQLLIQNGSTGDAAIKFNISGDTYSIGIDNSDGDKFKISASNLGTNDRIVIDSTGNVGIGTTNPTYKLDVNGGIRTSSVTGPGVLDLVAPTSFLRFQANANNIFYDAGGTHFFRTASGASTSMVITSAGNVGIGTTSPSDKLTVAGVIKSIGGTNNGKFAQIYVNDSFAYYTTNASVIYMSSELQVNSGRIGSYDEDLSLETSGTTRITVSNSNGNVGIGTTAPQQALHIKGATNALMMLEGDNDNGIAGCYYKAEDTDDTMNRTKGFFGFTGNNIYGNGYFTMWLDNANDDGQVTASEERFRWERDGDFHADGDVIAYSTTTPSDIRLKTDVETIESASEKVSKLRGVEYTWSKGKLAGQREIGLIAQEVEAVVPEVVKEKELPLWDDSGESYKTVDYEKLVALLIESNKELQARVEQLENKLDGFTK